MHNGLITVIKSGAIRIIDENITEDTMDIGKIISAILSGFNAYGLAAKDKEITINEALTIGCTFVKESGIGDQKFASLKK
jgi:hypothetical protein